MAQLFHTTTFLISLIIAVLASPPTQAQTASSEPAAIIEDIQAEGVDFEPLDLVYEGDVIELGDSGTLKLAYLRSCIVEGIEGGTVTVGREGSDVANRRHPTDMDRVKCDGGGIVPTAGQDEEAGGFAFRGDQGVLVLSTMPVFAFIEPVKELIIERVDPDEDYEETFAVTGNRLDLADEQVRLVKGGKYRATSGERSVRFVVSDRATETSSNVISRLVGF